MFGIIFLTASTPHGVRPTTEQTEFFESKIRPLLVKNCYQCHSEQAKILYSKLRVDGRASLLNGGTRGAAIVPGDADASQLIQAVRYENLEMPPAGRLTEAQIQALVRWVEIGAPWPDLEIAGAIKTADRQTNQAASENHWAWKPVKKVPSLPVRNNTWPADPIDNFILKKLEARELAPSPDADRYTLLRRVYFDLIGLPPEPEDVAAFVHDDSELAFEKVIDRLLISPGFGERWGRHWLDLTSYADSLGQGRRIPAREAWRYRDYVINAFNSDKPYDRFVQEQVSGDVLPWKTDAERREQLVATGFLAIGPWAVVDSDKEKLRMDVVDQQLDTLGRALQGLTLGCARCHDHKFDPIPTREYYALAGIFRSTRTLNGRMSGGFSDVNRVLLPETPSEMRKRALATEEYQQTLDRFLSEYEAVETEKKRLTDRQKALDEAGTEAKEELEKELKEIDKKLKEAKDRIRLLEFRRPGPPMAIAVQDRPVPKDCRVNIGGDPHNLGEEVPRGFLSVASPAKAGRIDSHRNLKGLYEGFQKSSGRLELAEWLIDPQNRLLARVMVNRIWHHLFGAGLVRTVDNFGAGGEPPSHPELLDYLASRFVELGWSVKGMIREIVLTGTYRQASNHNLRGHEIDPDNRLLWRANRRRLEAESYRDAVLAISGALDRTRGGPTLPLDIPESIALGFPTALTQDAKVNDEILNRRTIYLPSVRKNQLPQLDLLNLFDFPDPDQTIGARSVTTVPTQSLYLLNSPFLREQALLTARTLLEAGAPDDKTRVSDFFLQALNRPATNQEVEQALDFIAKFEVKLGRLPEASDDSRLNAWARYCHSVFASNEFLFRG
ncbi:MAG: DUF1553 domain-containing protein [Acidobacteriota bacterium]|nr:DUF1553 domain-containing protein [Acidobacteriota bacterium]